MFQFVLSKDKNLQGKKIIELGYDLLLCVENAMSHDQKANKLYSIEQRRSTMASYNIEKLKLACYFLNIPLDNSNDKNEMINKLVNSNYLLSTLEDGCDAYATIDYRCRLIYKCHFSKLVLEQTGCNLSDPCWHLSQFDEC